MLPVYLANALHVPIQKNGHFNSAIYLVFSLGSFLSGFISDYMRRHECLSLTNIRKLFQTIGIDRFVSL